MTNGCYPVQWSEPHPLARDVACGTFRRDLKVRDRGSGMRRFLLLIVVLGLSAVAAACAPSTPPKTITTPNYRLHFTTTTTAPRPLVIVLGASGRALAEIARVQGQDDYADQQGYVVAYLQAPPNTDHTWATG